MKSPGSGSIVKADIKSALARRAHADAEQIAVAVKGSAVTLTETVHSLSERQTANESAWRAPGVYDVVDRMTMAPALTARQAAGSVGGNRPAVPDGFTG